MTDTRSYADSRQSSGSAQQSHHLGFARPLSLIALSVCFWALQPSSARSVPIVNGWTITLPPDATVANVSRINNSLSEQKFDLTDSFSSFQPQTFRIQAPANSSADPIEQFFNITFMVKNTTRNAPFGDFSITLRDLNVVNGTKIPDHIFPEPNGVEHPVQAHVHPAFPKSNDNTFKKANPIVPDNLGTTGIRVFDGRLAPGSTWMRTVRFHDGVVANTETAFTFTLSPSALPRTAVRLESGRSQTFTVPEPMGTTPEMIESTSETIRDFVLLGDVWSKEGDALLFEPTSGERSDVIRFVNVANGVGGALTANVFFASDAIAAAQEALLPTLPQGAFLRGFSENGGERGVGIPLTNGSVINTDIFSDLQDPPSTVLGFPSDRITFTLVPEPASWLLLVTGCMGLLGYGWRRRQWTT